MDGLNQRVLGLYKLLMSQPEGPNSQEYQRSIRKHVRKMSEAEKQAIMGRAAEIDAVGEDWFEVRTQTFLTLGFTEAETRIFARCRLDSPGIRKLITERVAITQHATDEEIDRINAGSGTTLLGLTNLFGRKDSDG